MSKPLIKKTTFNEVVTNNKTLCISALRSVKQCQKCDIFKNAWSKGKYPNCSYAVDDEVIKLLEEKRELLTKVQQINKQLDSF